MQSGNRGTRDVNHPRTRSDVIEDVAIQRDTAREVEGRAVCHTEGGVLLHRNLTAEGIHAVQSSQRNVAEATGVNGQRVNDDVV